MVFAGRTRWAGDSAVLAALAVALVPMGWLHVAGSTVVDPVAGMISDYVRVPGGYELIGVSAVALAVAGQLLIGGVRATGLPHARAVTGLLVAWGIALVVVAVFPTNDPGTPAGVVAWTHRLGGAVAFTVPPVVAALVARRAREDGRWAPSAPVLGWWAAVVGVCTAVFLAGQVPVGFGFDPLVPWIGLLQRLLFAMVIAMLVVLARAVQAAAEARDAVAVPGLAVAAPVEKCGGAA